MLFHVFSGELCNLKSCIIVNYFLKNNVIKKFHFLRVYASTRTHFFFCVNVTTVQAQFNMLGKDWTTQKEEQSPHHAVFILPSKLCNAFKQRTKIKSKRQTVATVGNSNVEPERHVPRYRRPLGNARNITFEHCNSRPPDISTLLHLATSAHFVPHYDLEWDCFTSSR